MGDFTAPHLGGFVDMGEPCLWVNILPHFKKADMTLILHWSDHTGQFNLTMGYSNLRNLKWMPSGLEMTVLIPMPLLSAPELESMQADDTLDQSPPPAKCSRVNCPMVQTIQSASSSFQGRQS
jgi:hypothetical protein